MGRFGVKNYTLEYRHRATSFSIFKTGKQKSFCQNSQKWFDTEKTFFKATQVNAWSGLLLTNGEKISDLCADLEKVQVQQQELDNELDKVASQQAELEG